MPLVLGLLVTLLIGTAEAQTARHEDMWWRNPQLQQALMLTAEQVQRLERLFNEDLDDRIAGRKTLKRLEKKFAELLAAGEVSRIEDSNLIDRMEEQRARINVRRATMLMAMYRTLSADQRKTLNGLHPPRRLVRP